MITVIGIFDDANLAEEASLYLLANEFTNENVDRYDGSTGGHDRVSDFFNHLMDDPQQAGHYASLGRKGTIVTVHALSPREAQEAADALNNYGATEVNAADDSPSRSQSIERIVAGDKRLRTN